MKKKSPKPSESEMEILNLLWQQGASTVRKIHDMLNAKKGVGYTTTLKVMQRMYEKKLLSRKILGKSHLYEAAISEEGTQSELLDRILDLAFGGSSLKLVVRALGSKATSKDDLQKIREYLDNIERRSK